MTTKDEQKKAQDSSCPMGGTGDGKVWMVAFLGFLVGLLIMYLAMPAIFPPEVTVVEVPSETEEGEEPFNLDETKVAEIGALLSDTYLLNTGEEIPVTYMRYETEGSHAVLYYEVMGQEMPIYVSNDYEYLYPSAIDLEQMKAELAAAKEQYLASLSAEPEPEEDPGYPTSEEPVVRLAVMSNCPFGNQAENGIVSVVELLEGDIDFEPVYIISNFGRECTTDEESGTSYCSLHGNYELFQNLRERVVFDTYGAATWAQYVTKVNDDCFATGDDIELCWKTVAEEMDLNATEIEETVEAEQSTLLAAEIEMSNQMALQFPGGFGSPAMTINGKPYSGARTPEAYKTAICSSFTEAPEECSSELSDEQEGPDGQC